MIVKCVRNSLSFQECEELRRIGYFSIDTSEKTDLEVGLEYEVLAIRFWRGQALYYVMSDEKRPYPNSYPRAIFQIQDGCLTRNWIASSEDSEEALILSPPGWMENYYKLVSD